MKTTDISITYVYDALCGWCYGFSPVMDQLFDAYNSSFPFEVISGGMVLGERVGPIGEKFAYIQDAYKTVEERTGIRFGKSFLDATLKDGSTIFNSMPPSLALSACKKQNPSLGVPFASALQKGIYEHGYAPEKLDWYTDTAKDLGLDPIEFSRDLESPEIQEVTQNEFQMSHALGVNGFPSVFVRAGNRFVQIARGYIPYDQLKANLLAGIEALSKEDSV